ncbi:MAG: tetratricopeptide repeat protein [Spirochaetia bacterium]|nr:tetratricopeptide repeat protein [Spirochaetia bacterium]
MSKTLLILSLCLIFTASCSTLSDRTILSDSYYNLGNCELERGNNKEAEKYFATAISYNSDNHSASYNLAVSYTLNGKYADAENLFQLLLKDDPNNVIIQNAAAWNMYKSGELHKAVEMYESVLKINPAYDALRKNCIRVYLELSEFDKASFHVNFLIEKSTLDSETLFLQGELQFLQDNPEAEDWYIAAVKKDSGNNEAANGLIKILHTKSKEKSIRDFYAKLDNAEILRAELVYEFSLYLLTLEEPSGFDYLRRAVQLGYDVTQVKKSDVSNFSDSIKKEFLNLLGEEFKDAYR